MDKETTLVQLKDINFTYHDHLVLENINLSVNQGEFVGIIGPNGSGKTTLLRTILGLLKPKSGEVILNAKVGYVPQKVTQFDKNFPITVDEVVSLGCINDKIKKEKINTALETVGLREFNNRRISDLSGGQQQRVFIAKALCSNPELLVLDEPTVGIDVHSQDKFYKILSRLNEKHNITIILVSHDIDVVVNEVNKLISINKRIIYDGTPKEFIKGDYLEKLYGKNRRLILHGH